MIIIMVHQVNIQLTAMKLRLLQEILRSKEKR